MRDKQMTDTSQHRTGPLSLQLNGGLKNEG